MNAPKVSQYAVTVFASERRSGFVLCNAGDATGAKVAVRQAIERGGFFDAMAFDAYPAPGRFYNPRELAFAQLVLGKKSQ